MLVEQNFMIILLLTLLIWSALPLHMLCHAFYWCVLSHLAQLPTLLFNSSLDWVTIANYKIIQYDASTKMIEIRSR